MPQSGQAALVGDCETWMTPVARRRRGGPPAAPELIPRYATR